MAQQPLCRAGTHEEEQRNAEATAQPGGKPPLWYSEILQRWVSDLPLAANGTLTKLPLPASKLCPDRLKPLIPPSNFGAVIPGNVYRGSMPNVENFNFLDSMKLKTILTLVTEIKPEYADWISRNGINHVTIPIPANKEVIRIEPATIIQVMGIVLDRSNYPLLIHCNKGKHRTGCVVGCLRKIQGESMPEIINEYHAYADPKARILDEIFMKQFDERVLLWLARENGLLPPDKPGAEAPLLKCSTPVSRMRN